MSEENFKVVLDDEYLTVIHHKSCTTDQIYTLVHDKRTGETRDSCKGYQGHGHCKHVDAFEILAGIKDVTKKRY